MEKQNMVEVARRVIKEGRFYTTCRVHESEASGIWSSLVVGYRWGQVKVAMGVSGTVWLEAPDRRSPYGFNFWRIYDTQFWYEYNDRDKRRKAIQRLLDAKRREVLDRESAIAWGGYLLREHPGLSLGEYEVLVEALTGSKRMKKLAYAHILASEPDEVWEDRAPKKWATPQYMAKYPYWH